MPDGRAGDRQPDLGEGPLSWSGTESLPERHDNGLQVLERLFDLAWISSTILANLSPSPENAGAEDLEDDRPELLENSGPSVISRGEVFFQVGQRACLIGRPRVCMGLISLLMAKSHEPVDRAVTTVFRTSRAARTPSSTSGRSSRFRGAFSIPHQMSSVPFFLLQLFSGLQGLLQLLEGSRWAAGGSAASFFLDFPGSAPASSATSAEVLSPCP